MRFGGLKTTSFALGGSIWVGERFDSGIIAGQLLGVMKMGFVLVISSVLFAKIWSVACSLHPGSCRV